MIRSGAFTRVWQFKAVTNISIPGQEHETPSSLNPTSPRITHDSEDLCLCICSLCSHATVQECLEFDMSNRCECAVKSQCFLNQIEGCRRFWVRFLVLLPPIALMVYI
ncbi:hypothetical protein PV10_05683 [Exophiala mesophila]|uniref:Uncharacterized protein n=1 Tax=Exophiala mesophila TaxID=212818 RepID=A0A0D1ZWE1_EXOME|nr:uncharacterized protein PV10_05683 [Exophiala mesophila]KIV91103.1 hypothetical protein PV10_05683 [Exophiala mesophila]